MINDLQQREVFHLTFMRLLVRRIKPNTYALKGGSNLRFFYNSVRYSEDMDLDINDIEIYQLKEIVMELLKSKVLLTTLKPFQITGVIPPDIGKAKQTETVQRFKTHLINAAGEDLFTKIEFSRRNLDPNHKLESVNPTILYTYKQPPLLISHYPIDIAIRQKIGALADRTKPQPRDVFDIFMLSPQIEKIELDRIKEEISPEKLKAAEESLYEMHYEQFRDTVCNYLSAEDQKYYSQSEIWDEIQLQVADVICGS